MDAFAVLADPVRRLILELLAERERAAGDITALVRQQFRMTQPAVSQQLKVLRDNGFASVKIVGSRRIYALHGPALHEADLWLDRFRAFWAPTMAALETEIRRGQRERRQHGSRGADGRSGATRVQIRRRR